MTRESGFKAFGQQVVHCLMQAIIHIDGGGVVVSAG